MLRKKVNTPGAEGYRELLQAFVNNGRQVEDVAMEMIDKISKMLNHHDSFQRIQCFARESIVKVPNLVDDQQSHLVVRCNEGLENLTECVKREGQVFLENAEKIRGLIDLNVMGENSVDAETQLCWKNDLIQMQDDVSSNHSEIVNYYRARSEIGLNILKQPQINDYWEELIELDEDFFFKLRGILFNLRMLYLRLLRIVYEWIQFPRKLSHTYG